MIMKRWRVGSFSMGIILVALGVIMLVSLLTRIDILNIIITLWPVIMICLGVEILLHLFIQKGGDEDTVYFRAPIDTLAEQVQDSVVVQQQPVKDTVAANPPKPAERSGTIYYSVKKGDTLSSIARKYHVSVKDIKKWNNLSSDFLQIGKKLKIKRS